MEFRIRADRVESGATLPPPGVCPSGQRERAVNPSAQPTEVRILPPPLVSYDVAIIGGGPAGSTTAYRLATRRRSRAARRQGDLPARQAVRRRRDRARGAAPPVLDRACRRGHRLADGLRAPLPPARLAHRAQADRVHDAALSARPLPPPEGRRRRGRGARGDERRRARARRAHRHRRRRVQRLVREAARPRAGALVRRRARGELSVGEALRRRDGARDRDHPRRLRLDLPEGRPRQRRRRRQRGGRAEAPRRAQADVRGVRHRPRLRDRDARLPAADARRRDDARARHERGDRRRGRASSIRSPATGCTRRSTPRSS